MTTSSWLAVTVADVRGLAPEALAAFDDVFAAVDTARTSPSRLAQRRIATLLTGTLGVPDEPLSAGDQACAEYAEQFVLDVAQITDADRQKLSAVLGRDMFGFVQALYVDDQGRRLQLVVQQLFGVDVFGPTASPRAASAELWPALERMMTAVIRLDALDPLTSELVRLRGARAHNCRVCSSRRLAPVVAVHGSQVLEQTVISDMTDVTDGAKAALHLTDAILWRPADVPLAVVEDVRRHFAPAAALEIVLDVVRNASNKIAVALGADASVVADGVEYFEVSPAGDYTYGLPTPV